jgi:hypothetical protein
MKYRILKCVSEAIASITSASSRGALWEFVTDDNNEIFESENLDIIEFKLKQLDVSIPTSKLKVITEIGYNNDYVFDSTDAPTQYHYEVNYYFDNVKDTTKSISGEAVLGTVIMLLNYSSTTYELDTTKTAVLPAKLTIGINSADNILNVYYKTIV